MEWEEDGRAFQVWTERQNRGANFPVGAERYKERLGAFDRSRQAERDGHVRWRNGNRYRDVIRAGESFLAQDPSLSAEPASLNRVLHLGLLQIVNFDEPDTGAAIHAGHDRGIISRG